MWFFDFFSKNNDKQELNTDIITINGLDYNFLNNKIFIQKSVSDNVDVSVIRSLKNTLYYYLKNNLTGQFYILNKPMLWETLSYQFDYEYENKVLVLLSPSHKILFVDLYNNKDAFEDYIDEFIEDIGSISREYAYTEILWRPKTWRDSLVLSFNISEIDTLGSRLEKDLLLEGDELRRMELLISLVIWSINDAKRIWKGIPKTDLEIIRKNILLFDTEQTRFIYNTRDKKVVKIQWLAWTWKTELLLHKLKEIYLKDDNTKIFFTCHNKILATDLKDRIPDFFNFMKVKKQIDWKNRLFVWNAWWSANKLDSWLYVYLCNFYNLPFFRFSKDIWYKEIFTELKEKIEEKKNNWIFEHALDYILIDESQDFPQVFFELCEIVAKTQVYIAWDIFQDIFETEIQWKVTNVDFVLSKCYRTDPKTLMFAHSIGMWLFESKKLNFLLDDEWEKCWYIIQRNDNKLLLGRAPMRRFNNLEIINPINILHGDNLLWEIIKIIDNIINDYPDVKPEDIAIIFLDNDYESMNKLELSIIQKYSWETNRAHETKNKKEKWLFLSNSNNVKWLEFSFVICVALKLNNDKASRNKIYTMLTRSFLKSYLIFQEESVLISDNQKGLNIINKEWYIETDNLSVDQINEIKQTTINSKNLKWLEDIVDEILKKTNSNTDIKNQIKNDCISFFSTKNYSESLIEDYINRNIEFYN